MQPIAAFVYCNRQAPPAGATAGDRLNAPVNSAHDDANTLDRQLNSALLLMQPNPVHDITRTLSFASDLIRKIVKESTLGMHRIMTSSNPAGAGCGNTNNL